MTVVTDNNTSPMQKGIKGEDVDFAFRPSAAEGPKKYNMVFMNIKVEAKEVQLLFHHSCSIRPLFSP